MTVMTTVHAVDQHTAKRTGRGCTGAPRLKNPE